jgi:hypothetical protein
MIPRHGFVDSRPITSIAEAEKLLEETLAVEDRAEFILMPFIPAKYSGIWTTGKLIIGSGTDGATAGHGSRVIPTLGNPVKNSWAGLLHAGKITDSPYIELLWDTKYDYPDHENSYLKYFVQLRNGPLLPDTIDYIPEEIEIKEVIKAEGDLLEWEKKAKEFSRGTVVYHPGGSLASHYSVHAVLANIPVLISREPVIGEVLKQNAEKSEPKINDIRKGFYLGATMDITIYDAAYIMILGCHNTSAWVGKQDILLGLAMGCAYRLTITAALGEYRHAPDKKRKPKREAVYNAVWNKVLLPATRTRYLKSLDSFLNDSRWPGSFGGKKWYIFASYAAAIYNHILDGDVKGSLENLNKCVNAVHNGGWAFDKFIHESVMNVCAVNPSVILLDIAPHLYNVILAGEKDEINFFKGKHHLEVEPPDEEGAQKDEAEEEATGTTLNNVSRHTEDECDCEYCQRINKNKTPKKDNIAKAQVGVIANVPIIQYTVKNQADFGVPFFQHSLLGLAPKTQELILELYTLNLLDKKITEDMGDPLAKPFVPLTAIYSTLYLHLGETGKPPYPWSNGKYVSLCPSDTWSNSSSNGSLVATIQNKDKEIIKDTKKDKKEKE